MTTETLPKTLFEAIIFSACKYYDITEIQLMERTRKTERVLQRKIVMFLLRRNTVASRQKIAIRFGFTGSQWVDDVVKEIDSQSVIYREISRDIKNIMDITNF